MIINLSDRRGNTHRDHLHHLDHNDHFEDDDHLDHDEFVRKLEVV